MKEKNFNNQNNDDVLFDVLMEIINSMNNPNNDSPKLDSIDEDLKLHDDSVLEENKIDDISIEDTIYFQNEDDLEIDEDILIDDEIDEPISFGTYDVKDVENFTKMAIEDKIKFVKDNVMFLIYLKDNNYLTEEIVNEIYNLLNKIDDIKDEKAKVVESKRLKYLLSLPLLRKELVPYEKAKSIFNRKYFDDKNLFDELALFLYLKEKGVLTTSDPVACLLVGPPGVGKTELSYSLGESVGLPVIYINLSNNSVITFKGTNKHYSQSDVGVFMKKYIDCKVKNPIILLDEVDKAGVHDNVSLKDIVSDILDPNSMFLDNFLEVGIDLSDCVFILTANNINALPDYLKDRCNVIYFEEYSKSTKKHIVKDIMFPKLMSKFKNVDKMELDEKVIEEIINKFESMRSIKRFLYKAIGSYLFNKTIKNVNVSDVNIFVLQILNKITSTKNERKIGFCNSLEVE